MISWSDYFKYDSNSPSGLRWTVSRATVSAGAVAGTRTYKGYYAVRLNRKFYYAHRVVWELHNGSIPDSVKIDHIDCNKENNRIENLRLATDSNNKWNCKNYQSNTSGYKGVFWDAHAQRWRAAFNVHYKKVYVGVYKTKEEAYAAICKKRKDYHLQFTNNG